MIQKEDAKSQPSDLSNWRRQSWEFRESKTIRISRVKNILAKMDSKREGERGRKHEQKGPFK